MLLTPCDFLQGGMVGKFERHHLRCCSLRPRKPTWIPKMTGLGKCISSFKHDLFWYQFVKFLRAHCLLLLPVSSCSIENSSFPWGRFSFKENRLNTKTPTHLGPCFFAPYALFFFCRKTARLFGQKSMRLRRTQI